MTCFVEDKRLSKDSSFFHRARLTSDESSYSELGNRKSVSILSVCSCIPRELQFVIVITTTAPNDGHVKRRVILATLVGEDLEHHGHPYCKNEVRNIVSMPWHSPSQMFPRH